MKKFLSLALVVIMLLSTLMLTSCDPIGSIKGFFGKIIWKDGGARGTISLSEWIAAGNNTNYTLVLEEGGVKFEAFVTDDGARVEYFYGEKNQGTIFIKFDNFCLIRESTVGWLGYEEFEELEEESYSLANVLDFDKKSFEKLTYDKNEKCYYTESYGTIIKYYFEEGKLVRMVSIPSDPDDEYYEGAEIKNIGTTVVEFPEYTIVNDGKVEPSDADESVRTTVTNEDLLKHLDMTNLTATAVVYSEGFMSEISLKIAENGLELTATQDGEIMSQYMTIIDGILYSIEPYGEEYLATSLEMSFEEMLAEIGPIEEYLNVDNLVYDEVGRYYVVEIDGDMLYLYFENGQLVKAVCMVNGIYIGSIGGAGSAAPNAPITYSTTKHEYPEIILVISDVGTTEVEIPEFVKQ